MTDTTPDTDIPAPPQQAKSLKDAIKALDTAVLNTMAYFDQLDNSDIVTLLKSFALLKANKENLSELEKVITSLYQKLSYETIPNVFKTMEVDALKAGGKLFTLSTRVNASIPEDKRELGYSWIKEVAKVPELIKPTVNAKQLSSFVAGYFEANGKWPPEEAMTCHQQDYIQVRKA